MPRRAPRRCPRGHPPYRGPGCPICVQASNRDRNRAYDAKRPGSAARGYDWKWRTKHRPAQLRREPNCRLCGQPAEEVDHIDGDPRNNDPQNLRSLCKPHHSHRTAVDQSRWGGGSKP